MPKITKEKEVFDNWNLFSDFSDTISSRRLYRDSAVPKGIIIVKNGNMLDTLFTASIPHQYVEKNKSEILIRLVYLNEDSSIHSIDYSQNIHFGILKKYHTNGKIKTKGIRSCWGFDIGEWHHFDEKGNYTYSENMDEGYCSYKKVLKVCKKYNIKLERTPNQKIKIKKNESNNWEIESSTGALQVILLEGKTGKVIERTFYDSEQVRWELSKKMRKKVKHIEYTPDPPVITSKTTLQDFFVEKIILSNNEQIDTLRNVDILTKNPEFKTDSSGLDLNSFINRNFMYPKEASRFHLKGRVIITFIIDEEGNISEVKPLLSPDKQIGYGLEDEAIRIIKKIPKWTPALLNDKPVKTNVILVFLCDFEIQNFFPSKH